MSKKSTTRVTLALPDDLYRAIKAAAVRDSRSARQVINLTLIAQFMGERPVAALEQPVKGAK